jgi:hypothetical protein
MLLPAMHFGLGMVSLGLGACSVAVLTPEQVYTFARGAGFPPDEARDMVAIADRESSFCPTAYYGGTPAAPETSYGLVQVNTTGNPGLLAQLGLSDPTALYDPATNLAAAYALWAGNDANLNTAWYINKGGTYTAQYQADLPEATQAAMAVEPDAFNSDGTVVAGYSGSPSGALVASNATTDAPGWLDSLLGTTGDSVSLAGFDVPVSYLVVGGVAALLLWMAYKYS